MNLGTAVGSKASLENLLTHQKITFHYNPTEIGFAHDAEGSAFFARQTDLLSIGSTRLNMSQLIFVGKECRDIVTDLMAWVLPNVAAQDVSHIYTVTSTSSRLQAGGATSQLVRPPLRFQWGSQSTDGGFDHLVELMRFDCSFTRFTASGVPIRAEVRNLTLHLLVGAGSSQPGGAPSRPSATTPGGSALADGRNTGGVPATQRVMGDGIRPPAPPRRQLGGKR